MENEENKVEETAAPVVETEVVAEVKPEETVHIDDVNAGIVASTETTEAPVVASEEVPAE